MKPLHFLYNLIGSAVGIAVIPPLWLHHKRNSADLARLHQRLGLYPEALYRQMRGRPRIWLHAVSVGEVGVAAAIIKGLKVRIPQCHIVLSTTTEQGLARAKAQFKDRVPSFYVPVDLMGAVDKALAMVKPDILALLETEIWPNLIIRANQMGVRTAILNGRISVRAIKSYLKIRPFIQHTLSKIDMFSMISSDDAHRIIRLGADEDCVSINGNAKFDGPDPIKYSKQAIAWASQIYSLNGSPPPVFVAGSTRDPEEKIVLEAFLKLKKSFPDTLLIIAPRHIERVDQIEQWVRAKGLSCQRRSCLDGKICRRTAEVVILDSIGELSDTYSVANFVFCGGSLAPLGGQNLLEPAAWAKPVMYGPSMEDFADARQLIEAAGGGLTIHNADQMAAVAEDWIRRSDQAVSAGKAARKAILAHRGAALKHAEALATLLE